MEFWDLPSLLGLGGTGGVGGGGGKAWDMQGEWVSACVRACVGGDRR